MLDAAHGETVGPIVRIQRVQTVRMKVQVAGTVRVARTAKGRRRPAESLATDTANGSRQRVTVARSRIQGNRWVECAEDMLRCFGAGWSA